MPIDNATLLRHTPPPPRPRSRPWWIAPLILLIGAAAFAAAFALALSNPTLTRIVVIALITYAAVFWLWRVWIGWQEGGLLGAWYRDDHPMGSMLVGDEERDGLAIALWILSGLAIILSIALMAMTPNAFAKSPTAPQPRPPGPPLPHSSSPQANLFTDTPQTTSSENQRCPELPPRRSG